MTAKKLVIGASGFVGSHVTRKLVECGEDVRVMVRTTSSIKGIDDLDVEKCYGDVFDHEALRAAMVGCDAVFYCVVDVRAWLRDPSPLFRTNVDGLRNVLDAALGADLKRFVFMSTIATLACNKGGPPVTEDDPFNWYEQGGGYTQSRVDAENLVLRYARDKGLPAVALCISNTVGPRDWAPTPHGRLIAAMSAGKMPVYPRGFGLELVGIEDAAEAMVLAMDKGMVGERYIISERFLSVHELHLLAAAAGGVKPPRIGISRRLILTAASASELAGSVLRRDVKFTRSGLKLLDIMSSLDHSKAERELGWRPAPIEESIRTATEFYRRHQIA